MKKSVKIGTKVKHTLYGGGYYEGVVESIEKCEDGEKYGELVDSMPMRKKCENYVLCLNNGHWCYGYQVLEILE